jgi:hypothetical protein
VLDANLTKNFAITERFHAELKMAACNATNRLNRGDPDTNAYSSKFGQTLLQGSPAGTFGAGLRHQLRRTPQLYWLIGSQSQAWFPSPGGVS